MADVRIDSATVITMDPDRRVIDDGSVAIDADRIVAVGPTEEVRAAHPAEEVIDGRNHIVMPGMTDLMAKAGHATLRCLGEDLDGATWRNELLDGVASRHATERWFYVDAQLGAAEKLKYGVTAIMCSPGFTQARMDDLKFGRTTQRAIEDLGIRATMVAAIGRAPWPQERGEYIDGELVKRTVTFEQMLDNIEAMIAEAQGQPSRLVRWWVGANRIGSPSKVDPVYHPEQAKYLERQYERLTSIMQQHDVGFFANGQGDAIEYAYDHDFGILTDKTVISHGNGSTPRAIEILAETGTSICHNPRTRRAYLFGQDCPVVEMIDAGVTVALGADGPAPDRSCDPLLNVRAAMTHQRYRFHSEHHLPPGKALEMATIDGYRALGLDEELGSLEVGKRADLVVLDARRSHIWPIAMPVQQVAYYATGEDVRHVFVDGEQVVRDHQLTQVDEEALLDESAQELERLMAIPELKLQELASADPGFGRSVRPERAEPWQPIR